MRQTRGLPTTSAPGAGAHGSCAVFRYGRNQSLRIRRVAEAAATKTASPSDFTACSKGFAFAASVRTVPIGLAELVPLVWRMCHVDSKSVSLPATVGRA